MIRIFYLIIFLFSISFSFAQKSLTQKAHERKKIELNRLQQLLVSNNSSVKEKRNALTSSPILGNALFSQNTSWKIGATGKNGLPSIVHLNDPKGATSRSKQSAFDYLNTIKAPIQIEEPEQEFRILEEKVDQSGQQHIKLQQTFKGLKVHGGEVWIHESTNQGLDLFTGKNFPTPIIANIQPTIDQKAALEIALQDVSDYTKVDTDNSVQHPFYQGQEEEAELVIYHPADNLSQERLTWELTIHPNNVSHWKYFIDAQSGAILHQYSTICQLDHKVGRDEHATCTHTFKSEKTSPTTTHQDMDFDGPEVAELADLNNQVQRVGLYETGGTFYLLDVSKPMFNANASKLPNDPVGAIWTLDAQNKSPASSFSFNPDHIRPNNNNLETNLVQLGVSAHANASTTFEYYSKTFGRNSIDGRGGNIISFVNVADENGKSMENAFWDGRYIYYGNGGQDFDQLAKSLDVAGHEISHGVITNTANLEYFGESGAMNESYADIFAIMITRDNWQIGEEVVNPNTFRGGALRSLADPHNGGTRLGSPGWQPRHVNEQFRGREDNGGVHINSGILNHAFYLFSVDETMGEVNDNVLKTEQIYYRALTTYLTSRSDFRDLRAAIILSAKDLHGPNSAEVTAAANAFASVGITSPSVESILNTSPPPAVETIPDEIEANVGEDFILYTDDNSNGLYIKNVRTDDVIQISNSTVLNKPSITDNGREIIFVTKENTLKQILLDWSSSQIIEEENTISEDNIWRRATISRDGRRLAALFVQGTPDIPDNVIYVQDFELDITDPNNSAQLFELFNPTFTDGISTGTVEYADAIEFDFTGNKILYDARNLIRGDFGNEDLTYWDIGLLTIWNTDQNTWTDDDDISNIRKVFSGIPRDDSIGNPTFSKNSPDIIAFEYAEKFNDDIPENDYFILYGANLKTNKLDSIFRNDIINVPSFSSRDDFIIFNVEDSGNQFDGNLIIAIKELKENKISPKNEDVFLGAEYTRGAQTGVWFAIGERDLNTSTSNNELETALKKLTISPNPFRENLLLEFELGKREDLSIEIFNLVGQQVFHQSIEGTVGENKVLVPLSNLHAGSYRVNLKSNKGVISRQVVKL